MTPETAAARIVAAVERGDLRVLLGAETHVVDWGKPSKLAAANIVPRGIRPAPAA
jgi:hypothetical protein